jgi:hypothetical protein
MLVAASMVVAVLLQCAASAIAAGPPSIGSIWIEAVASTGATFRAEINPNGVSTTYRFEFISEAAYLANLEAVPTSDGFEGAAVAPFGGNAGVGAGSTPMPVSQRIVGLPPSTGYRYRVRAVNSNEEAVFSAIRPFGTKVATSVFALLDGRGWEMVSPIAKGGGAVQQPGQIAGGGVFQAAAAGGAFTYSSADSFGAEAAGAPAGSQYLAVRGPGAWSNVNITTPALSGSYGDDPDGVPYQLFSSDLSTAILSNGERCRGDAGGECPVANPPLPRSGARPGYRDYYLRTAAGSFESLLTSADLEHTNLSAAQFEIRLVGATSDLSHVILSSCAALTGDATEVPAAGGCDPAEQNLYEWSGGGLTLVNVLPGEVTGTPGATLGAQSGAVSTDGSRVYFSVGGALYLWDGGTAKTVLGSAGVAAFQVASTDGGVAYLVNGGQLERYEAAGETLSPLTSGGGVEGVLGISDKGDKVYYAQSGAVFLRSGGSVTQVAASATSTDWPPATGTSRVTADGSHLVFLSNRELTGYPNEGMTEVFLYGPSPGGPMMTCVSCNPTGEGPAGPGTIPGAIPNGSSEAQATDAYKPRVMSTGGDRIFFDSGTPLVVQDTSEAADVYEWEADGSGTCGRPGGCLQLISSGRDPEPSYFLDADGDGGEVFFLTAASLYSPDPGSYDVYDTRIGGGVPVPTEPIPCIADSCQDIPEAPEDPTPGTLVPNAGNPRLKIAGERSKTKRRHAKRKKHHKHRAKTKQGGRSHPRGPR